MERKGLPKPSGFDVESSNQGGDQTERGNQDIELGHSQGEPLPSGADPEDMPSVLLSRKSAMTQFEGKALGLDKAILHSIDCCGKNHILFSYLRLMTITSYLCDYVYLVYF